MTDIVATTFEEFMSACAAAQRSYIDAERSRFHKARFIATTMSRLSYSDQKAVFAPLGLWPHTVAECNERLSELDRMETEIPQRFGDNAVMRWSFQCHQERTI